VNGKPVEGSIIPLPGQGVSAVQVTATLGRPAL
jgi:hypothetical protein